MNGFIPGLEQDLDIRQELRFIDGVLDLRQFNKVFIAVSGGKDSHAMLFLVREIAEKQGALDRLVAMYSDTGMEWYDAEAHVRKICSAAGIPLKIVYPHRPMLEQFAFRLKYLIQGKMHTLFPSPQCRYCTSSQKVSPMSKFMRDYGGNVYRPVTLLQVTGQRWEESKERATLTEFSRVDSMTTRARKVYAWHPMLRFTTEDVFSMIRDTGVERHQCYDLGCKRLGCAGCIFSIGHQLKVKMQENPMIFEALDKLEIDSGVTMSLDRKYLRDRIK